MSNFYFTPPLLAKREGVKTGITTTSTDSPFNLALHVPDSPQKVIANRRDLCQSLSIPFNAYTCADQVHGSNVFLVTEKHKGMGRERADMAIKATDSLLTNTPGIMLNIFVADCVPIILYDPHTKSGGLCHSGWRGTANNILIKTIESMKDTFQSRAEDIIAYIGPSIGGCCYQVGENVREGLVKAFPYAETGQDSPFIEGHTLRIDLKKANKWQLLGAGLSEENIELSSHCTFCGEERFFSHRKSGVASGRYSAFFYIL